MKISDSLKRFGAAEAILPEHPTVSRRHYYPLSARSRLRLGTVAISHSSSYRTQPRVPGVSGTGLLATVAIWIRSGTCFPYLAPQRAWNTFIRLISHVGVQRVYVITLKSTPGFKCCCCSGGTSSLDCGIMLVLIPR